MYHFMIHMSYVDKVDSAMLVILNLKTRYAGVIVSSKIVNTFIINVHFFVSN